MIRSLFVFLTALSMSAAVAVVPAEAKKLKTTAHSGKVLKKAQSKAAAAGVDTSTARANAKAKARSKAEAAGVDVDAAKANARKTVKTGVKNVSKDLIKRDLQWCKDTKCTLN